jgi:hypothetical protein
MPERHSLRKTLAARGLVKSFTARMITIASGYGVLERCHNIVHHVDDGSINGLAFES